MKNIVFNGEITTFTARFMQHILENRRIISQQETSIQNMTEVVTIPYPPHYIPFVLIGLSQPHDALRLPISDKNGHLRSTGAFLWRHFVYMG